MYTQGMLNFLNVKLEGKSNTFLLRYTMQLQTFRRKQQRYSRDHSIWEVEKG